MAEDEIKKVIYDHDRYLTSALAAYTERLQEIIDAAIARTIARLSKLVTDDDGTIRQTPGNQRLLRSLDSMFSAEVEKGGFRSLSAAFVNQFPGQLPYFEQILDQISASLDRPLPSLADALKQEARAALSSMQLNTLDNLQSVVDTAGLAAKRQILFSIGGMKLGDLAAVVSSKLGVSVGQAETIADTAQTMYYRNVAARTYDVIQADLPSMVLKFEYEGPDDKITRAFCHHLLQVKKVYTREQIDRMDNGQIPDVFVSCGGFNCRHQWMLAL